MAFLLRNNFLMEPKILSLTRDILLKTGTTGQK